MRLALFRSIQIIMNGSEGHEYSNTDGWCFDCDDNNPCTHANIYHLHQIDDNLHNPQFYFPHCDPEKFVQCDAFYQCWNMPCAPGTAWSVEKNACDHCRPEPISVCLNLDISGSISETHDIPDMKEFVDNFVHFMDDAVNYRAEYATVLFNHQAFPLLGLGFLCGGCTSWLVDWLVNDTYGWTVIGNGIKMCREKLLNEARYNKNDYYCD